MNSIALPDRFTGDVQIAVSLLPVAGSRDPLRWGKAACTAGADRLHLDAMEPDCPVVESNQMAGSSFSPEHVRLLKAALPGTAVDVHLVTQEPSAEVLSEYLRAGADAIAIHWEAFLYKDTLANRIQFIGSLGAEAWIAVCPATDMAPLMEWLEKHGGLVSGISFCGTEPGLGGAVFDKKVLAQIAALRRQKVICRIQVDGGVEPKLSAPLARTAGADILVAGSAVLGAPRGRTVARMAAACRALRGVRGAADLVAVQFLPVQRCVQCGWSAFGLKDILTCKECGSDLEFVHHCDLEPLRHLDEHRPGLWRYGRLLPVTLRFITSAGEGNTPVVFDKLLSEKLGVELYLKLETKNPTGTFKDREGAFVVSRARAAGMDNLVFQSTGNTALALSFYAGLAALHSWAFIPARNAYKLIGPHLTARNKIILVDGEPCDVKRAATLFAQAHGFPKVSPFHWRSEANVTISYELAEQILRGNLPNFNVVTQTIAAGMGPIGIVQGFARMARWSRGHVTVPRLLGVEISEFAPLHRAWLEDQEPGPEADTPTYGLEQPYEPTLHTTNARPYYAHLRAALKASGGTLVTVQPWQAQEAKAELRTALARHGVSLADTENSAFIGYAGLKEKIRDGWIEHGSRVLLMVTGKAIHSDHFLVRPDALIRSDCDLAALRRSLEGQVEVSHVA